MFDKTSYSLDYLEDDDDDNEQVEVMQAEGKGKQVTIYGRERQVSRRQTPTDTVTEIANGNVRGSFCQ